MSNRINKFCLLLLIACLALMSRVSYANGETQDGISKKYGLTIEEEVEIGFQTTLSLVKTYGIYKNPIITGYVTDVGDNLVKKSSKRPQIKYRFIVLNTPEINAFAAPGGFIFVTKGTLSILDNEAELAGILAHEITHVEEGHCLQALFGDPDIKNKIRLLRTSIDAGEGLSQRGLKMFDEDVRKSRGASNTVNFDSAIESKNIIKNKLTD